MKAIYSILLLFTCVVAAEANDTDSLSLQEEYMQTVVVTGTRTNRTLDNTPVITRIITEKDIEKIDAANIKDVLMAEIPGLEFSYSMDQQVSMRLQGLGGMSILFLIDGEKLAGETLDNVDFNRLNIDDIERIEIVKGAASTLYGSNSVGAVIHIITKQNSKPWALELNSRIGTRYGDQQYGSVFSINSGKITNIFNLNHAKQDSYTVENLFDKIPTEVYGTHHWNFKDKLVYRLSDNQQITGRAGYYFHERKTSPLQRDRARDFSEGLRYNGMLNNADAIDITYTGDRYDKSDYYPQLQKDFLVYTNMQHSLRAIYTHNVTDKLIITTGFDLMSDYLKSYQFEENKHHSQVTGDILLQSDWTITDNWSLVSGMRVDYFSKHGWEITPKVAALYSLNHCKLRMSYSRGFRAPTLKEMYMDFNMANIFNIYGNNQLTSEHSNSFSVSTEYIKKYFCLTISGYFNMIENQITTIWDPRLSNGRGAMKYQNIGGTNLASIDVSLIARMPIGVNFKSSYSYFHEFTRHGNPNTADTRPHTLTAQVDYSHSWKDYSISTIVNGRVLSKAKYHAYANGMFDSYAQVEAPAYTIWKFTLLHRFFDAVTMTMSIDNLFDYKPKTYQYNSPFTLGRSYNIGLKIDVERIIKLL